MPNKNESIPQGRDPTWVVDCLWKGYVGSRPNGAALRIFSMYLSPPLRSATCSRNPEGYSVHGFSWITRTSRVTQACKNGA